MSTRAHRIRHVRVEAHRRWEMRARAHGRRQMRVRAHRRRQIALARRREMRAGSHRRREMRACAHRGGEMRARTHRGWKMRSRAHRDGQTCAAALHGEIVLNRRKIDLAEATRDRCSACGHWETGTLMRRWKIREGGGRRCRPCSGLCERKIGRASHRLRRGKIGPRLRRRRRALWLRGGEIERAKPARRSRRGRRHNGGEIDVEVERGCFWRRRRCSDGRWSRCGCWCRCRTCGRNLGPSYRGGETDVACERGKIEIIETRERRWRDRRRGRGRHRRGGWLVRERELWLRRLDRRQAHVEVERT